MTTTINASTSGAGGLITTADASGSLALQSGNTTIVTINPTGLTTTYNLNAPNTFSFKNRIINGGFVINQRGYVTNTALSSGVYAHDRWKAGGSGCTYTFTQGSVGVNTTITITSGSLQQIIEGCNMPEGGTYVLSWTGTAQGKINNGSYSSSPVTATGVTAGANVTIEFNTGTVNNVQVESGSTNTSFDYRDYGRELIMCQRYFQNYNGGGSSAYIIASPCYAPTVNELDCYFVLPVAMRAAPSVAISSVAAFDANNTINSSATTATVYKSSTTMGGFYLGGFSNGLTAFRPYTLISQTAGGYVQLSAEL